MSQHVCAFARRTILARPNFALSRFEEGGSGPEERGDIRKLVGEGNAAFAVKAAVERVNRGIGNEAAGKVLHL